MSHHPTRTLRRLVVVLFAVGVAACSSGGSSATTTTTDAKTKDLQEQIAARTTRWNDYNAKQKKFTAAAEAVGKDVADRIIAAAIRCDNPGPTGFGASAAPYAKQGLPIPKGSYECDGGTDGQENVLIEIYPLHKRPNAADLVAAKRKLICKRAKDLGRRAGGPNDFPGIPYVMSADKTWIVEPDQFETNQQIATALGRPSSDMCAGIK